MQPCTPPVCSFGTRHYPSQRCAETRGARPSGAVGSETRPDQPRRHSAESSAGRPSMLKLMTAVTQDNDAHDNSENGGVEYNTSCAVPKATSK